MQQLIYRQQHNRQYVYTFQGVDSWNATARPTHNGLFRGRLSLYREAIEFCSLKEKNMFLHILMLIPGFGILLFYSFHIYQCGKIVGQAKMILHGSLFAFGNDVFELRFHSNFIVSVVKNEQQIAVFHRLAPKEYLVEYNELGEKELGLLLLFCAFYDSELRVRDGQMATNIIVNDCYVERGKWKP